MKTGCNWSVIAGAVLTLGAMTSAQANDDCANAILLPYTNDGQPGWGDPGGRLTLGSTVGALAEGTVISCQGAPNRGPGVWFKIVGAGNLTRISTDHPSTNFDTQLSVYCSSDDSCAQLACVVANNDIAYSQFNYDSEVEFCAAIGKTYYILVHGGWVGTSPQSGAFGLVVEEPTDAMAMKIPCLGMPVCEPVCLFEVPAGAVSEHDPLPGGLPAYLKADSACDDTVTGNAASGTNGGCSVPAGSQRGFTPLTIGVAMKGDSHGWNGARDVDWFAIVDGLPVQQTFLIDYTFQCSGPIECIAWVANSNFSLCQVVAWAPHVLRPDPCGLPVSRRALLETPGIGLDGQPNSDLLFRVRNLATTGYDCASGMNDYWLRINWVLPTSNCPPIPDPPGIVGIDYNDERDPATATTFDGSGGSNGLTYEPCHYATPNDTIHRGKGGCYSNPVSDGDFIRLTPGIPQIGVLDIRMGPEPSTDVDWYKFELSERSLVRMTVQCGGPVAFSITENSCANDEITYATAATLGHCGPNPMELEGVVVLDAGVYIVRGRPMDEFSNAVVLASADCTPTSSEYGVLKYRIDLTATPAPPCCAGNADQLSGLVNFEDIVAVLANWQADYGLGATGPGDATCGAGDGVVNLDDINAVLANWLTACP